MEEWMVIGRKICWQRDNIPGPVHTCHGPSRSVTLRTRISKKKTSTPRINTSSRSFKKNTGTLKNKIRARTSVGISHHRGSVESISSLSDVDEPSDTIRRRSKSVDAQRGESSHRQMTTLQRSGSATRPLTSIETARSSAGHRSCLPAPLATQHNKAELNKGLGSLLSSNLTHGMRPFAPRNPSDIRSEDVVKFSRQGGKLTQGMVKFVGHLPGRNEAYLGVELDRDEGKHDGTFEGIRYFKCKPNKGVFVAFNKVVMAWAP